VVVATVMCFVSRPAMEAMGCKVRHRPLLLRLVVGAGSWRLHVPLLLSVLASW
jgi:hypothetical protein